jgi:diguanylate cyclase (GGDEF)-like protein/PAS domain S-box-containing protein
MMKDKSRVNREMAVIAEIGRVIGSTLDIGEVYERFAAEARKLIPFDRINVNLKAPESGTVKVAYLCGIPIAGRNPGDSYPLEGSCYEKVNRTLAGWIQDAKSLEERAKRSPGAANVYKAGIRSQLHIPLISQGKFIGSLVFHSKTPSAHTEKDLSLAQRIGDQIAGAIANAQLFAELKRTEGSLRESEGRFRALVEQAAVGVAEIEIDTGRFLMVNLRLCELIGRVQEEMATTTFNAIMHPEDLSLYEAKTALLSAGKIGNYTLEERFIRKDGGIIWVNITASPLWKPGEEPKRHIVVVQDITEHKWMEEEIREMSLRDWLTGLHNRRGFVTLAEQQFKASNRTKTQLQLVFTDVDGLKWINDNLGHEEGDKALIDTAQILRQTFRESDIIARLGGDEFAILAIDTADSNPEAFAKRLQQNLDACNAKQGCRYKLAMSWGAAIYDPESPLSLDELMSSADELMYAQKRSKPTKAH